MLCFLLPFPLAYSNQHISRALILEKKIYLYTQLTVRGLFRTQSNMYDGALLRKQRLETVPLGSKYASVFVVVHKIQI